MPVWCAVDERIAWERASGSGRPLAVDRTEFSERYARRQPIYESLARAILPSNALEAAGPAAPWLAAMQGTPGVRMAWAESESGAYPAAVGEGALGLLDDAREALPEDLPARTFCVADDEALRHHRRLLPRSEATIGVQGAESSKTIAEAERILGELSSAGANRDDCVLAFGGGVVGDLAGFCAATYQRGIALVQAPDDPRRPGRLGVRRQDRGRPSGGEELRRRVPHADRGAGGPATLRTLPPEELAAGFVEVVKTALIAGDPLWSRVGEIEDLDPGSMADVIFECARTKIDVVASDERDSGRRMVLNLGHTVGHAIEAATLLLALPPRRGGRPWTARGASALGCGGTAQRGRGPARPPTACRSRWMPRSTSMASWRRWGATRSGQGGPGVRPAR